MEEEDHLHRHVRHASVALSSQLLAESLHKEHGLDFEPSVDWWEHPDAAAPSAYEAGPSEGGEAADEDGSAIAPKEPTIEERAAAAARRMAEADKLLAEVYKRMENSPPKGEGRPPGAAFTKKGRERPGSPKPNAKSSRASKAKKQLSARKKKEAALANKGERYLAAVGAKQLKQQPKHQITGYEVEKSSKKQEKEPEKFSVEEQARAAAPAHRVPTDPSRLAASPPRRVC